MKKTNLVFFSLALSIGAFSCSHSEPAPAPVATTAEATPAKVEYEFGGKCANAMKSNRHDVMGNPEHSITHNGKHYCFSSAQKREEFNKDLDKNIAAAEKNWKRKANNLR